LGAFYSSTVIRSARATDVSEQLRQWKRIAYTVQCDADVYVYDQACEQDDRQLQAFSKKCSKRFDGDVISFLNHDDDVLLYFLAHRGSIVDKYDSCPGYFSSSKRKKPRISHPEVLAERFDVPHKSEDLLEILSRTTDNESGYVFESRRHDEICSLLGLDAQLCQFGFGMIEHGLTPEGHELCEIGDGPQKLEAKRKAIARTALDEALKTRRLIHHISLDGWGRFVYDPQADAILVCSPRGAPLKVTQTHLPGTSDAKVIQSDCILQYFGCEGKYRTVLTNKAGEWTLATHKTARGQELYTTRHGSHVADVRYCPRREHRFSLSKDFLEFDPMGNVVTKHGVPEHQARCFAIHPSEPFAVLGTATGLLVVELGSRSDPRPVSIARTLDIEREMEILRARMIPDFERNIEVYRNHLAGLPEVPPTPFAMEFSPDGEQVFVATSEGLLRFSWEGIRSANDLRLTDSDRIASGDGDRIADPSPEFARLVPYVYSLEILDDTRLLFGTGDGRICLHRVPTGETALVATIPDRSSLLSLRHVATKGLLLAETRSLGRMKDNHPSLYIWDAPALLGR